MQEVGVSGPDGSGSSASGKGMSHSRPRAFGKRFNLGHGGVGNTKEMFPERDIWECTK